MKKNNLLKNVSNVNDASSQVISASAGLEGKIKDTSTKYSTKNSESVVKKSVEAAVAKKFDIETSENGEVHTAMNMSEDAVKVACTVGVAGYKLQKKVVDKIFDGIAKNKTGGASSTSIVPVDSVFDTDNYSGLSDLMSLSMTRDIEDLTGDLSVNTFALPDHSSGIVPDSLDMTGAIGPPVLIGLSDKSAEFAAPSISNLVDKNKIKLTNQSAGIKNINTKYAGVVFKTPGKQRSSVSPGYKASKELKKKNKSSGKSKSSFDASYAYREGRKAAINFMIKADTQQDNNMSSGAAGLIQNISLNFVKGITGRVGKFVGKQLGKLLLKAAIYGSCVIVVVSLFFLPLLIPFIAIGSVGGIGSKKINDEISVKADEELRQIIDEEPDIFGKFSNDVSDAPLGTLELSYDELKKTFTWMSSDNAYPVKDQDKIITSQYTLHRTDVEDHTVHYGVDFNAPMDSELVAIADATVEVVDTASDYGNHVILRFDDGTYCLYAHMSDFVISKNGSDDSDNWTYLKVDDKVKAGDLIGHSGSTGDSTGPHLHMVLSTSPYGSENGSRYDYNAYVKEVWCPDFEFSYDYGQSYGIFEENLSDFIEDDEE